MWLDNTNKMHVFEKFHLLVITMNMNEDENEDMCFMQITSSNRKQDSKNLRIKWIDLGKKERIHINNVSLD